MKTQLDNILSIALLLDIESKRIGADEISILVVDTTPPDICIELSARFIDARFKLDACHWTPAGLVDRLNAWYNQASDVTAIDYLQLVKGALHLRLELISCN